MTDSCRKTLKHIVKAMRSFIILVAINVSKSCISVGLVGSIWLALAGFRSDALIFVRCMLLGIAIAIVMLILYVGAED